MVLHKLLFLRLPYEYTEDLQQLHEAIVAYPGFETTPSLVETCERRHIPRNVLLLLEKLLHLSPHQRPSAERVRLAIESLRTGSMRRNASSPWRKKATGTGPSASDSYGDVSALVMPTNRNSTKAAVLNQAHRYAVFLHCLHRRMLLVAFPCRSQPPKSIPGPQATLSNWLAA